MLLRCVRGGQVKLALSALGTAPIRMACRRRANAISARARACRAASGHAPVAWPDRASGADLNRAHAGLSPLIAATRDSHEGRTEAVTTLLTNGARPNAADSGRQYAAAFARRCRASRSSRRCCAMPAPHSMRSIAPGRRRSAWPAKRRIGNSVRFLLERGAKAGGCACAAGTDRSRGDCRRRRSGQVAAQAQGARRRARRARPHRADGSRAARTRGDRESVARRRRERRTRATSTAPRR